MGPKTTLGANKEATDMTPKWDRGETHQENLSGKNTVEEEQSKAWGKNSWQDIKTAQLSIEGLGRRKQKRITQKN